MSGIGGHLTPAERDRQARGKDPYAEEPLEVLTDGSEAEEGPVNHPQVETFPDIERRGEAMQILDNPLALMAHAQATGDSTAGQRLRFTLQLCGYEPLQPPPKPNAQSRGGGRATSSKGASPASKRGGRRAASGSSHGQGSGSMTYHN